MVRRDANPVWQVATSDAGSTILFMMGYLYKDIREEMITEKVAEKTDQFMQVR